MILSPVFDGLFFKILLSIFMSKHLSEQSKTIETLPLIHQGKVRDIYEVDSAHLLIVTSDRISAFDHILPSKIPGKGQILNKISLFWFNYFADIIPNHLANIDLHDVVNPHEYQKIKDCAVIVKKAKALPIEAIVRGYIIGSGWQDYQKSGKICGLELPAGLQLAEQLAKPVFTPSSKAAVGDHDENISFEQCKQSIGKDIAEQIKSVSIEIYRKAAEYAKTKGIIIADTKFEFGLDANQQLVLIDEVLTPDSSRFWEAKKYQLESSPASFDKQFVRDYLLALEQKQQWNKQQTPPELPAEIIAKTQAKYQQAMTLLVKN